MINAKLIRKPSFYQIVSLTGLIDHIIMVKRLAYFGIYHGLQGGPLEEEVQFHPVDKLRWIMDRFHMYGDTLSITHKIDIINQSNPSIFYRLIINYKGNHYSRGFELKRIRKTSIHRIADIIRVTDYIIEVGPNNDFKGKEIKPRNRLKWILDRLNKFDDKLWFDFPSHAVLKSQDYTWYNLIILRNR